MVIRVIVLYCTKLVSQSGLSLGKGEFCYERRGESMKKRPGVKTTSTKEANLARGWIYRAKSVMKVYGFQGRLSKITDTAIEKHQSLAIRRVYVEIRDQITLNCKMRRSIYELR